MTPTERLIALLAALLASLALLVATTGCTTTLKGPVPVVLSAPMTVNATVQPKPWCYVSEPPTAPTLSEIDSDNADVIGRVMIHRREYAEMVQFAHDTQEWMGQMRTCLDKWSQP